MEAFINWAPGYPPGKKSVSEGGLATSIFNSNRPPALGLTLIGCNALLPTVGDLGHHHQQKKIDAHHDLSSPSQHPEFVQLASLVLGAI